MVASLTQMLEELKEVFTPTVAKAEVCINQDMI